MGGEEKNLTPHQPCILKSVLGDRMVLSASLHNVARFSSSDCAKLGFV